MKSKTENDRWRVLIACCLVNLCLGSIYSWSVFSQAMTDYLNQAAGLSLNPGDLAIVYTIANCVGPLTMITGGMINDMFGPRLVILVGGILFGGGMILSGFAHSVGFLIISFGIVGGLGLGMAYGSAISTSVKLFPEKRGFVGGITTAAYGISSVIIPPVVSGIVAKTSAPFAFKTVGAVFLVVITVSSLCIRVSKEDIAAKPAAVSPAGNTDMDWRGMIRLPVFYLMLVLLICGAFSGMMIISQASPIAVTMLGMDAGTAAVVVSVLAVFNTLGRIAAGSLSDRIGRIGTLQLACIISALAQGCLLLSSRGLVAMFYLGIVLAGLSFGSFMGVYPGFTADRFGLRNNSVNYGIICIGFALAGYFGPLLAKYAYNSTGSYRNSFIYAFIFSICALILAFVCKCLSGTQKKGE